jgi:hypothetical protein
MALSPGDWTVTRATKVIAYIGADHTGAATYATVIEFHRWLQGLADDAVAVGDDELDITNIDPSRRSTDNIITLINGYTINDTEAEHLYDGSVIQNGGNDIYDGIVNFGNSDVQIQIIQNGAVLTDDWWNHRATVYGDGGLNFNDSSGISHRFMIKTRTSGADVDGRRLIGTNRTFGKTFGEFKINGTARGNNVFALNDSSDLNNATLIATIAALSDVYINRTDSTETATANSAGQPVLNVSDGSVFAVGDFILIAGDDDEYQITVIASNALTLNHNLSEATSGGEAIYDLAIGFTEIDVNNDTVNEQYYSQWDRGANTINTFYERLKWLSRDGSSEYIYGLSGELFRGITHEVVVTHSSGVLAPVEAVSWDGGTGQMFATNSISASTRIWIQLLTGVAPSGTLAIEGGTSGAIVATATTVTDRSSLVSTPFVGASTGSAIIGSYGLGIEKADLTSADKVFELLSNAQITPPNNVTNTVTGLVHNEDRILLAPWDGSATDTNGDPEITKTLLGIKAANALTTNNITSVFVDATIPSDTPSVGYIRVTDDQGFERRLHYSSWTGDSFIIDTTDGNEDFLGNEAAAANNVYLAYIDELALGDTILATATVSGTAYVIKTTGTTDFTAIGAANSSPGTIFTATGAGSGSGDVYEQLATATFTSVQAGTRNLVLIVRDGASTPIKQYISSWSQTSSDSAISVIRTTDA